MCSAFVLYKFLESEYIFFDGIVPNDYDGSGMSLQQDTSRSLFSFGRDRLPLFSVCEKQKSKLFFTLKFSGELSSRIYKDTALHAVGKTNRLPYPPDLLHMTLLCMEEFYAPPYQLIPRIEQAMAEIQARPLVITLDRSGIFGKEKHLALTSTQPEHELRSFVRMLRAALSRHNLPRYPLGSFKPHVTTIYDCGRIKPMPIPEPYSCISQEFVLVYSHYGETRHEEIGRWSFSADAPPYAPPLEQFRMTF